MFPWIYFLALLWCAFHLAATLLSVLIMVLLMQEIHNLGGNV
nr:tranforming protein E10 [Bos taurus papillomavirus 30]